MSTFDIRQDAPGLLRVEALQMTLHLERTSTTTARISWNIPSPAAGCTAENQAYNGIVIALNTSPASRQTIPVKEVVYTPDPTGDTDLHAGDKIGTALVVGAFYGDKTTTFVDITGLHANTPYYASGYPVDAQYRYYIEGIHSYSQEFKSAKTDDTSGTQAIVLNPQITPMGVKGSDSTGLLGGELYDFVIQLGVTPSPQSPVDTVYQNISAPKYTITINGTYAQTFTELVQEINKQFGTLENPAQGPYAPNTNGLYWSATTSKLFLWNGDEHVEKTTIIYGSDPTVTVANTSYWYNTTTEVLSRRNGSNNAWTLPTVIKFATDPTLPICNETYWYDDTNVYLWNGTTWCITTLYSQNTDPSVQAAPPCGSYWYNTTIQTLYKWNEHTSMWDSAAAIVSITDPNNLANGAYWFNTSTNILYTRDTVANPDEWDAEANVSISETAPLVPAPGKFWYKPTTTQLFQRNVGNTAWDELEVIAFTSDPTVRTYCDVWWDTTSNEIKIWDEINNGWAVAANFYDQAGDPTVPPSFVDGDMWYNPDTELLYVWANNCFTPVTYIHRATDPTSVAIGIVWQNGTVFKVMTGGGWSAIDPVNSGTDPTSLASGIYWYNTSNDGLQIWNGAAWVTVTYSLVPLTPELNTIWFDSTTNILKTWDGTKWIVGTPLATVELDFNGNLLFTHTKKGSLSFVGLTDGTLFDALTPVFTIHDSHPGTDGRSDEPTYNELDIGTDGSNDERFKLMNEIRYDLGYPTMDVELTQEQLDFCVSRAIEELRARASASYKQGFFFMHVNAENQRYLLTNRTQGMNKIVSILGIYRLTSSFLSSAHGAGVYGQIVMQHLYNMGTFDLLSYHIMSEYTELMEIMFAGRITFSWDERTRQLWFHHRFAMSERMVLIEATIERTEQDILTDRLTKVWVRRFATAKAREILADIRGKFSTLPGAGGSVSLNSADLRQRATEEYEALFKELEDFVYDRPEDYGIGGAVLLG